MKKISKITLKQKKSYKILMIIQLILIIFSIIFISNKVKAARNYTSINSTTIFDKSSLDSLNLNIKDFPEVTVEGTAKAEINDPKTESRNDYRVTFRDIPKGNKIDATVTALFKNCGTLNGKDIDIKIVYSNMVASNCIYAPNQSFLFWRTFGKTENQKDENEWWYAGIERVDLDISFYYHGETNPINLDTAYISIYSEDYGEGIFANGAAENYLYDDTTIEYHPDNYKTQYVSKYYSNVFVGTAGQSTAAGNKERVGFRYEDETNLRLTLLAFDETQNVGYHLRFTPLTGVVPDNPTKTIVNKKENVKPGEKIIYEIKQPLVKRYDESFQYDSVILEDILDSRLEFNSIKVDFSTGSEITQSEMEQASKKMGKFNFDRNLNKIVWELDWNTQRSDLQYSILPFQMLVDANGGWIKFTITTTVKNDVQEGIVKNKATTKIQNKYELSSNEVETTIKKEEVEPKSTKGKVIVHHVDKITNIELDTDIYEEEIGNVVRTSSKTIDGYKLFQSPSLENYKIQEGEQHVYYYYKYWCEITVIHMDKITNEKIRTETKKGLEGESITTHVYEKPNYVLFAKPETEEYQFTRKNQIVYYYYKKTRNS